MARHSGCVHGLVCCTGERRRQLALCKAQVHAGIRVETRLWPGSNCLLRRKQPSTWGVPAARAGCPSHTSDAVRRPLLLRLLLPHHRGGRQSSAGADTASQGLAGACGAAQQSKGRLWCGDRACAAAAHRRQWRLQKRALFSRIRQHRINFSIAHAVIDAQQMACEVLALTCGAHTRLSPAANGGPGPRAVRLHHGFATDVLLYDL